MPSHANLRGGWSSRSKTLRPAVLSTTHQLWPPPHELRADALLALLDRAADEMVRGQGSSDAVARVSHAGPVVVYAVVSIWNSDSRGDSDGGEHI